MRDDRIERLTESQRQCLRLVADGIVSSKVIAARTGLSPSTIDQYLYAAGKVLGSANRVESAALFAALDKAAVLSQDASQLRMPALADPAGDVSVAPGGDAESTEPRSWLGLPPIGGRYNDAAWTTRSFDIIRVAAAGTATMLAIVMAYMGLTALIG
jgi:DNA-binding CsgD family transcriptional regulator